MKRRPFYQVPSGAWLFRSALPTDSKREQHEEPVRQWCAFELMRAYGIAVTDISLEQRARVGSKSYGIDLLVSRNGSPWIVIECNDPAGGAT